MAYRVNYGRSWGGDINLRISLLQESLNACSANNKVSVFDVSQAPWCLRWRLVLLRSAHFKAVAPAIVPHVTKKAIWNKQERRRHRRKHSTNEKRKHGGQDEILYERPNV